MSVTTSERSNPPPRRKSCAACTRAKRRCDLSSPTCQRCAGRGINCHYPQRRGPAAAAAAASLSFPAANEAPSAVPDFSIDALMDDFWGTEACSVDPLPLPDFAAPTLEMPRSSPATSAHSSPMDPFAEAMLRPDDQKQVVRLPFDDSAGVARSPDGVQCSPEFINERLHYLFEHLPATPQELVDTLGTSWCHPSVFRDVRPKAYEDLISSCALYTAIKPANKTVILRIIVARMQDLANARTPADPREALAHAFALTVYHVMACLDGDVESRAAAESTLPTLLTTANSLMPHANLGAEPSYPATLSLSPLAETEAFWKSWILTESVRRTIFFAYQFHACYSLLSGASSIDCCAMSKAQCWTLAAPLWHAQNAVDFAVAWGSNNRFTMTVTMCETNFDVAAAKDVCKFGRMAMTCFVGHQAARGWFAARGGEL